MKSPRFHSSFWRHLLLVVFALVMIYPLLWMLSASFKPEGTILTNPSLLPSEATLGNYVRGWTALQIPFSRFFINSFFIAGLCVLGNVLTCATTAYAFARLNFRFKRIWFALMLATIMLPGYVVVVPQYVLFLNLDWINTYWPLIVPKFFATDAFFIFLIVQFIRGIPRELDEVSEVDGANHFQIFWSIIFPLSTPALITTAIFTFIWNWDDFFSHLLYISDISKFTVSLALRAFVDTSGQSSFGPLLAMSILALAPTFLLFVVAQRWLVQGIATTGFKG